MPGDLDNLDLIVDHLATKLSSALDGIASSLDRVASAIEAANEIAKEKE